jgi:hypothetical protein
LESWFYFIDSPADTPIAFASRIPAVAYEIASAGTKLEESNCTNPQHPVTRIYGQVKVWQKKLWHFHVERLRTGLGHVLEVEVLVAWPA